jgi:hypothetical protein
MKDLLKQFLPHSLEENIHAWLWSLLAAAVLGVCLMAHTVADAAHQSVIQPPCGCLGGMDNE